MTGDRQMQKTQNKFSWFLITLLAGSVAIGQNIITLNLHDSYGDGWNGGILTIAGNSYTVDEGYESSFMVDLSDGTHNWSYTPGNWPSENSWDCIDNNNNVLFEGVGPDAQSGNFTLTSQTHFNSVEPTGLPYHIIISSVLVDDVPASPGTEIGVFDDTLCVGLGHVLSDGNIDIVTWEGSANPPLPGFTAGHAITAKLYVNMFGTAMEIDATISPETGNGTFGSGSFSVISLSSIAGIAPNISVNNPQLQFGAVQVGETEEQSIEITNAGNVALDIASVTSNNTQYEIPNYSGTISVNESITLVVEFTPEDAEQVNGEITIVSNDPDEPSKIINLSGQGVPPSQAIINVSTDALDFETVNIGSMIHEQIQVFNSGSVLLTITDISLSSTSIPFSVQEESFSVEPGGVYNLDVSFSPSANTTYYEQLTLWSNASNNSAISINLSGAGYDSYFLPVAPTGLPYSVIVQSLSVDGHGLTPGDEIGLFQYDSSTESDICVGSIVINENNSESFQVIAWEQNTEQGLDGFTSGNNIVIKCWITTFDSTIEIMPQADWSVGDGTFGFGEFSVVSLTAESGIAPVISLNTDAIEYPPIQVDQSYSESVLISNTGQTNLIVTNITTDNDAFDYSDDYFVIYPDESEEIYVVFTPQSDTPHYGQLHIYSNDPDSPENIITLFGQGLPETSGELEVSFEPISFSPTIIGESSLLYFPLFNSGSEAVTVSTIEFECDEYYSTLEDGFEIAPGEIAQIPISFTPAFVGVNNCMISIANSSINNSYFSIDLSGVGFEGFFNTVSPTGLPHTIVIEDLTGPFESIHTGDEIGIFDGSLAVGVIVVTGDDTLSGVAWEANADNDLFGFTSGNPISFRYFTNENNLPVIYDVNHITITGTGNFGNHPYTSVALSATNTAIFPEVNHSIPDITTTEDVGLFQSGLFMGDYFSHPYDPLTYTIQSSDSESIITELSAELELLITPDENWFGVTDIFVTATDGYFYVTDTTQLTVDGMNDAPTIAQVADTSTFEDTHLVLPITTNDVDEDELDVTFLVDENLINTTYENGFATFTPVLDSSGVTLITTYVSDGELIDSMSFSLTVIPVNDAPVIGQVQELIMTEDDTLYYILDISDAENDSISVTVESLEPNINVTIDGFELRAIPEPNWFGEGEIQVTASDGLLDADIFINLEVESEDDPPTVINPIPDIVINEDSPDSLIGDLSTVFEDIDQELNYSVEVDNDQIISVNLEGTLATLHCEENAFGNTTIVFTAYNSTLRDQISDTVLVIVQPVNDTPQDFELNYLDTVFITEQNIEIESLLMEWSEALDEDGDPIQYSFLGELTLTEENGQILLMNFDSTLSGTTFQVSYQELVDAILNYEFGTTVLTWNVYATDGIDSVWASNGPTEVYIDIQDILSLNDGLLPQSFALYQNYPNPFNPTTTFEYDLPKTSDVALTIYDVTGREINQIQFFQKPAGKHRFVINGSNLGSGIYFLHFSAGPFRSTKKMMLIK